MLSLLVMATTIFFSHVTMANQACEDTHVIRDNPQLIKDEASRYFTEPVYQNKSDWCYAYTASALLSFKMRSLVSPAHLAILYNQRKRQAPDFIVRAGDTYQALDFSLGKALCLEQALPSLDVSKEMGKARDGTSWSVIDDLHFAFSSRASRHKLISVDPTLWGRMLGAKEREGQIIDKIERMRNFKNAPENISCQLVTPSLHRLFDSIPNDVLVKIISDDGKRVDDALLELADLQCSLPDKNVAIPKHLKIKSVRVTKSTGAAQIIEAIKNNIQAGKPSEITADLNPLRSEENRRQLLFHSMVVTGQKKVGAECYYIVKNSLGPNGCHFSEDKVDQNGGEGLVCKSSPAAQLFPGEFMIEKSKLHNLLVSASWIND